MIRKSSLTDAARDALEARGIPPEIAESMGVRSVSTQSGHGSRSDQEWIGFRHHIDGGEHDQWTYRSICGEKGFFQDKGGARVFWNNESIGQDSLIITEGHLDALAFIAAGYRSTVSVPSGAPNEPGSGGKERYAYLDAAETALRGVNEIILAVDNDPPGRALFHDLVIRLGRGRCRFVTYPDGCKDANDVLIQHGIEGIGEIVASKKWCKLDGLYQYDEIPPAPPIDPIRIGLDGLDDLWRPAKGRMTVLTGVPGHGKGTLITDVVCRLAQSQNAVVAIASFEDDLAATLTPRLASWYQRDNGERFVADHFVFISPDPESEETPTVDWFLERARAAVIRHNATVVVLDPWNEMDHSWSEAESRTEYIGQALSRLRRHARYFNYHLIVTAHPTKLHTDDSGKYAFARGYNIDGSAHWFNKPDSGLTIYRDADDKVKIGCWKCRLDGVIGTRGHAMFSFDQSCQRYTHRPDLEG